MRTRVAVTVSGGRPAVAEDLPGRDAAAGCRMSPL
jgi:hypothetical protein